jgi:uncharacterized membrane protein
MTEPSPEQNKAPEAPPQPPAEKGTGIEPKVAGLLCYVLGWISGIVFLILEPKNKFVRFHAIQSIIVFGALSVAEVVLSVFGLIPFLGILFMIIIYLLGVCAFILWIVLMFKAYQGQMFKLPVAGPLAEKWNK